MAWIKTISFEDAVGSLKNIYNRVKGPNDQIDRILQVHAMRPHTLKGHMSLYKNVLHHLDNTLPKWYLECIGVYVSQLNNCEYCVLHHLEGVRKLLPNKNISKIKAALENRLNDFFSIKEIAGLHYAQQLTLKPALVTHEIVNGLKTHGFSDGEILEINQVTSYFNYANRTVLGLGVTTEGEALGLSPSGDDEGNWGHE